MSCFDQSKRCFLSSEPQPLETLQNLFSLLESCCLVNKPGCENTWCRQRWWREKPRHPSYSSYLIWGPWHMNKAIWDQPASCWHPLTTNAWSAPEHATWIERTTQLILTWPADPQNCEQKNGCSFRSPVFVVFCSIALEIWFFFLPLATKLRRCKAGATRGCCTEKLRSRDQQSGEMTGLEPWMVLFESLNPGKT